MGHVLRGEHEDCARSCKWSCSAVRTVSYHIKLTEQLTQTVPLTLKQHYNWSAGASGLVLLGLVCPTALSPLIGHLAERVGPIRVSTFAFLAAGPFFAVLGIAEGDSVARKSVFCAMIAGIGSCASFAWIPQLVAIAAVAERTGTGQAYALMNVAYALGMTLGPIWAGSIVKQFGWTVMCGSLGAVGFVTGLAEMFSWRRNERPGEQGTATENHETSV